MFSVPSNLFGIKSAHGPSTIGLFDIFLWTELFCCTIQLFGNKETCEILAKFDGHYSVCGPELPINFLLLYMSASEDGINDFYRFCGLSTSTAASNLSKVLKN
jgi:hypothetical protein